MTKKDFTKIAAVLKDCKPMDLSKFFEASTPTHNFGKGQTEQWKNEVESIAFMLQSDNARFNKARFFSACGYSE